MADWRKLFSSSTNHTLNYFPPVIQNGVPLVAPPKEVFSEGANEWKHSLVAQFLGKPPNFNIMARVLKKLWEKHGNVRITLAGHNLFIFSFDNDTVCNWILENGPWHVQSNPMILRKWIPNLKRIDIDLDRLPLWFHLYRIPLELYNRTGISYLASAIGIPLYMDSITAAKKRLTYAKVCIEVCAAEDPPQTIEVILEDGSTTTIGVSIPWSPPVCRNCSTFGHTDKTCTKAKNKDKNNLVWVPKNVKLDLAPIVENAPGNGFLKEAGTSTALVAPSPLEIALSAAKLLETGNVVHDKTPMQSFPSPIVLTNVEQQIVDTAVLTHLESTPKTVVENPVFKSIASGPKKDKFVKQTEYSASLGQKSYITSSSNKFSALCNESSSNDVNDDEIDTEQIENEQKPDDAAEMWKQIVENAKFTGKKTRVAAKGVDKVL